MKRIPSVGWAFFGLAVAIYLVYLLNRGVFVGSDARLNMAPVEVFALENGRSPTAEEILALPTSRLNGPSNWFTSKSVSTFTSRGLA
jgi:hypothetical protein